MMINWQARQLNLKVVYYGPALSGKTTNLEQIHQRVDPGRRSELLSLKTNEDRTLFFDFFQLELGKICGLTPNIALYTVPGQSYYEASRRLVLRGTDGVVFVADSNSARMDDNLLAWLNMFQHLHDLSLPIENMPVVVQYNKRDCENALPVSDIKNVLGSSKYPGFEATALEGKGVFDTFKTIINGVLLQVQKNLR
ncbi:MAG: gliding-motility protein MglA [Chloroflexi bacterium HGW-Chloroflexi-10]|nr:MAG: gliding-motility protein MglA [Chloroflexi bacterium HGW-Chloroflexi-10]